MHEASLIAALLRQITAVAQVQHARKVVGVHLSLGALSHIAPEHLREHFMQAAYGTVADGARLDIAVGAETSDPRAQEVWLDSIEVET
jgi:hydrogenase nickel incorporation protein HypA/HybF